MFENPTAASAVISVILSVAGLGWFMSRQLSEVKDFVHKNTDALRKMFSEKLEYHERHDDKRFSDIVDDIWELRLRYAAVEGLILNPTRNKSKPKVDTE